MVIPEISTHEFVKMKSFEQIWNSLKFGPKMSFRTKFKFRTKNLGIFWCIVAVIWKSVCYTWYQQSWICRDARFGAKTKEKKKRKRKRKSWNLGWKMTCLGIFKLKFEKTIAIFDINTLKFVQMRKFVDNKKKSNLGGKMPYMGIIRL